MGLKGLAAEDILRPGAYKTYKNLVRIRCSGRSGWHNQTTMEAFIKITPLACAVCRKSQPKLYVIPGSYYESIGTTVCKHCGEPIVVSYSDASLTDISIGNGTMNAKEIHITFRDLYLLHWHYIEKIAAKYSFAADDLFQKYDNTSIDVNKLREILEQQTGIETAGKMKFITDSRFDQLPDDISRWIELLYLAGCDLGIEPYYKTNKYTAIVEQVRKEEYNL